MHVPQTPVLSKHPFGSASLASFVATSSALASEDVVTSLAASTPASLVTSVALEHAASTMTTSRFTRESVSERE